MSRYTPCPQLSESCQTTLRYKYCQQHTSPVNNDRWWTGTNPVHDLAVSHSDQQANQSCHCQQRTGEEEEISQPELCQLNQRFCRSYTFILLESTHTTVGPISSRRREASRCDLGSFRYRQCRHAGLQRSPAGGGATAALQWAGEGCRLRVSCALGQGQRGRWTGGVAALRADRYVPPPSLRRAVGCTARHDLIAIPPVLGGAQLSYHAHKNYISGKTQPFFFFSLSIFTFTDGKLTPFDPPPPPPHLLFSCFSV